MNPTTATPSDRWPDEEVKQPGGEGSRPALPPGQDAIFDQCSPPSPPSRFCEPQRYTEGDGETPIISEPFAIDD